MTEIRVKLKKTEDKSYSIIIEDGVLNKIPEIIKEAGLGHKFAIITDSNVEKLYAGRLSDEFKQHGLENKTRTERLRPGLKIRCLSINSVETQL